MAINPTKRQRRGGAERQLEVLTFPLNDSNPGALIDEQVVDVDFNCVGVKAGAAVDYTVDTALAAGTGITYVRAIADHIHVGYGCFKAAGANPGAHKISFSVTQP